MPPTVKELRILNSVLCGVALLVTAFRLYLRKTRSKLWWDDFWVLLSALSIIVLIVVNFLHTDDPTKYSRGSKIAVYYMCIQFYYAVSWTSRLSILYTVIRISFERMRRGLIVASGAFLISWIVLFAQVFWVCESPGNTSWKDQPIPQCELGEDVAIAQVITVVVSDAILIFAPIKLIWRTRLPKSTKIRLVSVFASTVAATAVSLYYIYALLRIGGITEEFAATIHDGVSLLVANLSVVIAFAWRLSSPGSSGASDEAAHENTRPLHHGFGRKEKIPSKSFALSTVTPDTYVDVHVEHIRHIEEGNDSTMWIGDDGQSKKHELTALPGGGLSMGTTVVRLSIRLGGVP
ncbi:unnamed protein product [Somion occarium]|uniref:Rhodopsin domain-containing protein n=1 Tax=Somion occarium TaxID=3059160 RepID=A0ABP1DP76_9APHY